MSRLVKIAVFIVLMAALAGCSAISSILPGAAQAKPTATLPFPAPGSQTNQPADQPTSAATLPAVNEATSTGGGSPQAAYPATPEEVVQSFLIAAQQAPDQMAQYLSPKVKIPAAGALALLKITGQLAGFALQSGSVNPEPAEARIVVQIKVGDKTGNRTFSLGKVEGKWVITAIVK